MTYDPYRLHDNGYSPIPIPKGAKGCFVTGWSRFCDTQPTYNEIEEWKRRWPGCGWGIACGQVVVIDIDELDPIKADEIHRHALKIFGPTDLMRVGKWPKRALIYQAEGDISSTSVPAIDILAHGKQFVGFHIHPETKKPYRWVFESLLDVDISQIPKITQEQINTFIAHYRLRNTPATSSGELQDIEWGKSGKAIDGREALLFKIVGNVSTEFGNPTSDRFIISIADEAWERFEGLAELTRTKGDGRKPYDHSDALSKARWRVRNNKKEAIEVPPSFPAETELSPKDASEALRTTIQRFFQSASQYSKARSEANKRMAELMSTENESYWLEQGVPSHLTWWYDLPEDLSKSIIAKMKPVIQAEVKREFDVIDLDHAPRLQIKAAAGLGKTTEVIEELRKHKDLICHYHVPLTELALELVKKLIEAGIPARAILGRGNGAPDNPMCAKYLAAKKAATLGLNIYKTLCRSRDDDGNIHECKHFKTCPYLQQFHDVPNTIIMAHEYLFLPPPMRIKAPDIIVIDENSTLRSTASYSFSIDRLPSEVRECVYQAINDDLDLKTVMINGGFTKKRLREIAKTIKPEIEHDVLPNMSEKMAISRLNSIAESEQQKVVKFLECAADEFDFDRGFHGVNIEKDVPTSIDGKKEHQHRVAAHWRRKPNCPNTTPILIIDADADLEINKRFFGAWLKEERITARRNCQVVQCISSRMSKYALLGKDGKGNTASLKKALKVVQDEMNNGHKVLVVTNKPVREQITGEPASLQKSSNWNGATITHFGAIRGCDEWKDYDTVIVVGREQSPPQSPDEYCRALWADDPKPLRLANGNYIEVPRGYRLANGAFCGVKSHVHPDERGQKILELIRERETVQAIDRLRLVHATDEKRVIILCNLPIDITIDKLMSLDQIAGTMARMGLEKFNISIEQEGILPLGARDLHAAFPDLWVSVNAAKRALEKLPTTSNNILFDVPPHYRSATYRRVGQRGKSSRLLYDSIRHPTPVEALEKLLSAEVFEFVSEKYTPNTK